MLVVLTPALSRECWSLLPNMPPRGPEPASVVLIQLQYHQLGGPAAETVTNWVLPPVPHLQATTFWARIRQLQEEDISVAVTVESVNKGGMLVKFGIYDGFIPVSQFGPVRHWRGGQHAGQQQVAAQAHLATAVVWPGGLQRPCARGKSERQKQYTA